MADLVGGFVKGAAAGYDLADKAAKDKKERDAKKAAMTPAYKRGGAVKKRVSKPVKKSKRK